MKIGILGTRGIPNNYGGFEQCAENLSKWFKKYGHVVIVYNPHYHSHVGDNWNGAHIKKIYAPEKRLKIIGTILYDRLCLIDAVKQDFDIILELGYAPASLFFDFLHKTKAKLITNMDGLEWKRQKWGPFTKKMMKYCERLAVKKSNAIVVDHPSIGKYFMENYGVNGEYIGYGAQEFKKPNRKCLKEYNLKEQEYFMLVSRLEPENNTETILDGYVLSGSKEPFLVIGKHNTKFGNFLKNKFKKYKNIRFLGGIYNFEILSSLRWFAKLYFHGHSAGGTPPSLVEAMSSNAFIASYDNEFNRYILGNNAFYFSNKNNISDIITNYANKKRSKFIKINKCRIKKEYNWEKISKQYLDLFEKVISK